MSSAIASRAVQGLFLLLLLVLLLVLLGGGFGFSTIFGCSFGGRLSLLFFCAKVQAGTMGATSIAIRIRFSCFITALLLVFLTHANKGEAESCATATSTKPMPRRPRLRTLNRP